MKNVVLASLLLLGVSDAFGVTVEKDGVSIKYEKCTKYRTIKFGMPYCIRMTNLSSKPITVNPSIISAPFVAYQEVAKALHKEYKFGAMLMALTTVGFGALSHSTFKELRAPNVVYNPQSSEEVLEIALSGGKVIAASTPLLAPLNLGGAGLSAFLTAYLLYKLATETPKVLEAKLAKEVFHAPITIQTGESIEKIFWLKNPNDPVEIDFDTVKVGSNT